VLVPWLFGRLGNHCKLEGMIAIQQIRLPVPGIEDLRREAAQEGYRFLETLAEGMGKRGQTGSMDRGGCSAASLTRGC